MASSATSKAEAAATRRRRAAKTCILNLLLGGWKKRREISNRNEVEIANDTRFHSKMRGWIRAHKGREVSGSMVVRDSGRLSDGVKKEHVRLPLRFVSLLWLRKRREGLSLAVIENKLCAGIITFETHINR